MYVEFNHGTQKSTRRQELGSYAGSHLQALHPEQHPRPANSGDQNLESGLQPKVRCELARNTEQTTRLKRSFLESKAGVQNAGKVLLFM